MTELIVALDRTDTIETVFHDLRTEAGVSFFKIGADALMMPCNMITYIRSYKCDVFLDLKLYDTRDTVERIAHRAFELGVRFLTVHTTPSMLDAAMRAKILRDYCKVLAVESLTDIEDEEPYIGSEADGLICSVNELRYFKKHWPDTNHIFVCPGIRQFDKRLVYPAAVALAEVHHNHLNPATPAEAKAAGANYIVVGRPIYNAFNPVQAAKSIIEELSGP